MHHYTYLLKCSDGTFYCGYTTDLKRRVGEHNSEKSKTKYTRARTPVTLYYFEEFKTKEEAMKREYEIKQLSHKNKELIKTAKNI